MDRWLRGRLRVHPARYIVAVTSACAALAALAASRALANDCMGPNFAALKPGASFFGIRDYVTVFYVWPVCLVEAGILKLFFKVGYVRCLWYAVVANLVSTGIGLLWMVYSNGGGWKTAIFDHEMGRLTLLLVRSFLVTVAEETLVVLLLVGKLADVRTVLKAVTAANVVSYAASAALLLRFC